MMLYYTVAAIVVSYRDNSTGFTKPGINVGLHWDQINAKIGVV